MFKCICVDHIGIACKDLDVSKKFYTEVLGLTCTGEETVEEQKVKTVFIPCGETLFELLVATSPESPIAKFIDKKGEGIHHIAFAVDDIRAEVERLKAEGFIFISEEPKDGADNKLVVFLHPKSTNGVLVELCQEKS